MKARLFVAGVVLLGCSSKEEAKGPSVPTYSENVAPILRERCESCHHDGGIGPFALSSYAQAKRWAPLLTEKAESRAMPPWGAFDSDDCKMRFKIKHDLRLTDKEIATLKAWSEGGTPEGDPAKAPAKVAFADQRLAGASDTLAISPYKVAPAPQDELRCFPVDPKVLTDTWIDGVNVVPGDTRVVHHVLVYVDPKRQSLGKAGADGSYSCFGGPDVSDAGLLMAWAPGVQPLDLGPEAAMSLPKDAMLVVQMHYHPTSVDATDGTKVELRRRSTPPPWKALVALIGNSGSAKDGLQASASDPAAGPAFVIPAGAKNHVESMSFTIPPMIDGMVVPELRIHSAASHMHWVGKNMKIEIERAIVSGDDPAKECLLGTPKYDFNWQRFYQFDAPIEDLPMVRAGDTLKMTCTYDNSMGNPYVAKALAEKKLPGPVDVSLGEQTLDEMCLGGFVILQRNR